MKSSKLIKPKQIPVLLIEDETKRVKWFSNHLPNGFRLIHARSGGVALGMIERDQGYVYGGILLDHDLQSQIVLASDQKLSGSHVIEAIISFISIDVPVMVHSMNPDKSPMVVRKLEKAGFWVSKIPWETITEKIYLEWLDTVKEEWDDWWEVEA